MTDREHVGGGVTALNVDGSSLGDEPGRTEGARSHWCDEGGYVTGYMCLTDFTDELGAAAGGNTVYPSIENLRENRGCVGECGIAEVRVIGVKVALPFRREATAPPQDSTSPATSPQSAATAAIRPPTNTTPTPVSADARSHEAPTKEE